MKNKVFSQADRDKIVEMAEGREFTVNLDNGKKYLGRLLGKRLDYPYVSCVNELGQNIDIEISWALACRIALGETNHISA